MTEIFSTLDSKMCQAIQTYLSMSKLVVTLWTKLPMKLLILYHQEKLWNAICHNLNDFREGSFRAKFPNAMLVQQKFLTQQTKYSKKQTTQEFQLLQIIRYVRKFVYSNSTFK